MRRIFSLLSIVPALALQLGCGGQDTCADCGVATSSTTSGHPGAGGSEPGAGGGQSGAGAGKPGAGGSQSGAGGGQPGTGGGSLAMCSPVPTTGGEFLYWSYVSPSGDASDCSGHGSDVDVNVDAVVTTGSKGRVWRLDACPPDSHCTGTEVHEIHVDTTHPIAPPPIGTFVHLKASIQHLSGPTPINCAQRLLVTNLPMWDAQPNPVGTDSLPWLDGLDTDASPFTATSEPFCEADIGGTCGGRETFDRVTVALASDATVASPPLLPAQSGTLTVPVGGDSIVFTARYAMYFGACENPGDSQVWVERSPQ